MLAPSWFELELALPAFAAKEKRLILLAFRQALAGLLVLLGG